MGGGDYATNWTVYGDVWSSADAGVSWKPVTLRAPWAKRAYLTVTAVPYGSGERLVLVGGGHCIGPFVDSFCHAFEWFADVWVSDDGGKSWENTVKNLTSPFAARGGHAAVKVQAGSVLFVGGVNGIGPMNDAWRSDDGGVSWVRVRANGSDAGADQEAPPREGLVGTAGGATPTFSFHNLVRWREKLWILAGASSERYVNTVWASEDGGQQWRLATPSAAWPERILPATVVVPDRWGVTGPRDRADSGLALLLAGGSPQKGGFAYRDVWVSGDGVSWTEVTPNATWPARGWQMMTTVPAEPKANGSATVVMTGGWTWDFPFRIEWTYFRDAWSCRL